MGFMSRLSTTIAPARRASSSSTPPAHSHFWYTPEGWLMQLTAAGVPVSPELAMTLAAMYAGVKMIGYDLATLPCVTYRRREDGGKDRVGPRSGLDIGGIARLAYMLRWQPNLFQTWTEFCLGMTVSLLMRSRAYAEIISGPDGFIQYLVPRHPDRVYAEMLPTGRIRYRLTEADGKPRYLTQDEMFAVRDYATDLNSSGLVTYGAQAIGSALATQRAVARFFRSGMTASAVATYKGELDDEEEERLHRAITRFATGIDNSFGLMLVPDDVTIENLAVEPEKAQMMSAQEWGVRDVARLLRIPPSRLGIKDSRSYNSQFQDAVDYVIGSVRPIAVTFEQAIQRDLILAKDTYFVEFLLDALLRGDPDARAGYYEKAIRNRWMRPSEVRLRENLNPDPRLDELSERDHRPGDSSGGSRDRDREAAAPSPRLVYRGMLAVHDHAMRCVRRERAAVEKIAKKHANDPEGWRVALREFYTEQAYFVAQTMRVSIEDARAYAGQHRSVFEAKGVAIIDGPAGEVWERHEADELAALALGCEDQAA